MKIQFLLKNTGMHERLGIMTLSSILKKEGHSVKLLLTGGLSEEKCMAHITDYKPDILAYSIMTGEHSYHIELNQMIRSNYNCFSIFGGPHPTFKPEMINKKYVDAICIGEGDNSFLELVSSLEGGKDFYNTPNMWFKTPDGRIIKNEIGVLVDDLDRIPFPDRALFYDADPALCARGIKLFMSMRGCPYKCTYCFNLAYNSMIRGKGQMLRYRSVDNMIAEIKEVALKYFIDRVFIDDDTFLLKPEGWLEEFADKYHRKVNIPITCNVRANLVNDITCSLLKKANVRTVFMGVECGNSEVANSILGRNLSNDKIIDACKLLHKYKIKFITQNLIGLPVDNPLKEDLKTLDFNISLKPDYAWSSLLYPYPGTELGRIAIEKGLFDLNFEKDCVSNKTGSVLNFGDEKMKTKIVNLHKLFGIIVKYPFLRPATSFLISLPLKGFYTTIMFGFYGCKILSQSSFRGIIKTLRHYIVFFFTYTSQLKKHKEFSTFYQKQSYPVKVSANISDK